MTDLAKEINRVLADNKRLNELRDDLLQMVDLPRANDQQLINAVADLLSERDDFVKLQRQSKELELIARMWFHLAHATVDTTQCSMIDADCHRKLITAMHAKLKPRRTLFQKVSLLWRWRLRDGLKWGVWPWP